MPRRLQALGAAICCFLPSAVPAARRTRAGCRGGKARDGCWARAKRLDALLPGRTGGLFIGIDGSLKNIHSVFPLKQKILFTGKRFFAKEPELVLLWHCCENLLFLEALFIFKSERVIGRLLVNLNITLFLKSSSY